MMLERPYGKDAFVEFLNEFLPDFIKDERTVRTPDKSILADVTQLGISKETSVTVLEAECEETDSGKRIAITQAAFKVLHDHGIRNALIAFHDGGEQWRLSLLTSTLELKDGKVIKKDSTPRRYSYLLGIGAKTRTPYKYLVEKGRVSDIKSLQERFSVEVVNKQFYASIAELFTKLIGGERGATKYPGLLKLNGTINQNTEHQEFAVRLIGRIIFSWFLKEKKSTDGIPIVPNELLSLEAVQSNSDYYHSILEPLFFELLNTRVERRHENHREAPFSTVPYLNGGLFSPQYNDYYNQSSYNGAGTPGSTYIPDSWFTELFNVLEKYNFTVDENTSYDVDLSIDPEMLGRIFENLLAEINPDTGESARKSTGSFYTPREIVDYMVDSSLLEFLESKTSITQDKLKALISWGQADDEDNPLSEAEKVKIVTALANLTILDPACGSGAFPIGILQKVVYILQQADPKAEVWLENQLKNISSPELKRDIQDKYENENYDWLRKYGVIRETIFGIDIQTIATEISKLRCFLTLIIEEEVDDNKPNRGVHALPNLDFKFVTANSLVGLPEGGAKNSQPSGALNMFDDTSHIERLKEIRNQYFGADADEKSRLRDEFKDLQLSMVRRARDSMGATSDLYNILSDWKPFGHDKTEWFDCGWMFGLEGFDIVIGNPPYGAKIANTKKESDNLKRYFKSAYVSARTINGTQKGSLDTYSLFVECGFNLLRKNGNLAYIVPLSMVSSDSISGLQKVLFDNCSLIRVSSYAKRPVQIFNSAMTANTIIFFRKSGTPVNTLTTTKLNRLAETGGLQQLIDGLEFTDGLKYRLNGRIPKISKNIENDILAKIFAVQNVKISDLVRKSGSKIYYRSAGGRYFNVVTDFANNLSSEKSLIFDDEIAPIVGAALSSTLFWWFQQVYTDCLNLKAYEVGQFTIPVNKLTPLISSKISVLYAEYLKDVENKAEIQKTTTSQTYNVAQFKVYRLRRSKQLIDRLDDLVCQLYELSSEEADFIKNYEIEFRMSDGG